MHRPEKAQEALRKLSEIQQKLEDEESIDETLRSVHDAAKVFGEFSKAFAQESFDVKVIEKNQDGFVLNDFDWKSLG